MAKVLFDFLIGPSKQFLELVDLGLAVVNYDVIMFSGLLNVGRREGICSQFCTTRTELTLQELYCQTK